MTWVEWLRGILVVSSWATDLTFLGYVIAGQPATPSLAFLAASVAAVCGSWLIGIWGQPRRERLGQYRDTIWQHREAETSMTQG
jgi:hypothetical protein